MVHGFQLWNIRKLAILFQLFQHFQTFPNLKLFQQCHICPAKWFPSTLFNNINKTKYKASYIKWPYLNVDQRHLLCKIINSQVQSCRWHLVYARNFLVTIDNVKEVAKASILKWDGRKFINEGSLRRHVTRGSISIMDMVMVNKFCILVPDSAKLQLWHSCLWPIHKFGTLHQLYHIIICFFISMFPPFQSITLLETCKWYQIQNSLDRSASITILICSSHQEFYKSLTVFELICTYIDFLNLWRIEKLIM